MSLSDLNSLLTTSEKESSKKEEKAKKETEEKSKKETEEKSKKEKENNKIGGEKESFWDKVRNFEKPEDSPNLFSSLMLTPFSFFGKALTSPNKQKIKEDIDRIKQLMK